MNQNDQPSDPKAPVPNFQIPATQQAAIPGQSTQPSSSSTPSTIKLPTNTTVQNKIISFSLAPNNPAAQSNTFVIPPASKPPTSTVSTFAGLKPTTTPVSLPATAVSTTSLPLSTSTPTTASSTTPSILSLPSATPAKAPAAPQSLTFQQLEELILNKWTAELYEQEKVFYNQATQINIWDKVINENAEKLTQLHTTMEKVRKQQTKINDDLEVISTHQKDLEACLIPLEKEDLLSVLKGDPNRKNLYTNAKKIDSQIKSMSENLKETIEHINETSRSHDTEDPVIQIGRILNAHMESLRWIDEHAGRMQDYFDSLLKVHDDLRRECDLSKH